MRVVEKIASHSLAMASSGGSLGNMAAAQAGVARANDGPVDLVARDELERRRDRPARRARLARPTLSGSSFESRLGLRAGNGQTRGAALEGFGHAVVEPLGGVVEARVGRVMVAQQRGLIVARERGDERSAGAISLLGDAARQGQRVNATRSSPVLGRA